MKIKNALIVGYGRAGRRHEKTLQDFGIESYKYDPFVFTYQGIELLEELLQSGDIQYAVICTPPDSHLEYIKLCLAAGLKVLCEKPLCSLGQLEKAKRLPGDAPVMVAYNYRYHPKLVEVQGKVDVFRMHCNQSRPDLPDWGLLLDHCSHDLDIVRMITGDDVEVIGASEHNVRGVKYWLITTSCGTISEMVTTVGSDRVALIKYPGGKIDIDPDPAMFQNMWKAFLGGDYYPDLTEAIKTQELLETCSQLDRRSKGNGNS
jgi:predicted dehydrogenase